MAALRKSRLSVYVSPWAAGWMTVVDESSAGYDDRRAREVAAELSKHVGLPCLLTALHDGYALLLVVAERGRPTFEYETEAGAVVRAVGDGARLGAVSAADAASAERLSAVLELDRVGQPAGAYDRVLSEYRRLADVAKCLGLGDRVSLDFNAVRDAVADSVSSVRRLPPMIRARLEDARTFVRIGG
ncbi:MAG: hypothetical protein ACAI43_20220 [Phycisphaerae bacterium]